MFTGIVEEVGQIGGIQSDSQAYSIKIRARKVLEDVHLGDSILVSGVCLTVTSFQSDWFTVDVMPETVKATTIQGLSRGSKVNLERAMGANGRFGGHFVSGHIDGVGKIRKKRPQKNAIYYDIEVSHSLLKYMILRGSITIDGTSLTLFEVTNTSFTISLIPHTVQESILGQKEPGDLVNVEIDMLAKYMDKLIGNKSSEKDSNSNLTPAFLEKHGFM